MKTIVVRGKEFKIDLINNYCSKLYLEKLYPMMIEHGTLLKDATDLATKAIAGKEGKERVEEMKKQAVILKEKRAEADRLNLECTPLALEIVKELLESNEIEYDENWWMKRTDAGDIADFLLSCMHPEYEIVKRGKKKAS